VRTIKCFIVLLFLFLLSPAVSAQDANGINEHDVEPAKSVEPDVMPVAAKSQTASASVEEMAMEPLPTSTTRVSQVAESRDQVVLLIGDSMADGLGSRFNDYAFIQSYGMVAQHATGRLLPTFNIRLKECVLLI